MEYSKIKNYLKQFQERFIVEYYDNPAIRYLAVVETKPDDFILELGVRKGLITESEVNQVKNYILSNIPVNVYVYPPFSTLGKLTNRFINKQVRSIKILASKTDKDFYYSNGINGKQLKIHNKKNPTKKGTFGGIVSLHGINGYFLITNHHVIMSSYGAKGDVIRNDKKEHIAKLHWGRYEGHSPKGGRYDIALAEIINPEYFPKKINFNYKDPVIAISSKTNASAIGANSGYESGTLYSPTAIVKIKKNWYKNVQILIRLGLVQTQKQRMEVLL